MSCLRKKKNGATIFYSSHVLSEVQKFCTRIGLIRGGKLIRETSADEFTNLGYRLVSVETEDHPQLSGLDGVAGVKTSGSTIKFMYSGNFNELISILGQINVSALHVEEPDLENVFMHYFKSENNDSSIV